MDCRANRTDAIGRPGADVRVLSVESRGDPLLGHSEHVGIVGILARAIANADRAGLSSHLVVGVNPGQGAQCGGGDTQSRHLPAVINPGNDPNVYNPGNGLEVISDSAAYSLNVATVALGGRSCRPRRLLVRGYQVSYNIYIPVRRGLRIVDGI